MLDAAWGRFYRTRQTYKLFSNRNLGKGTQQDRGLKSTSLPRKQAITIRSDYILITHFLDLRAAIAQFLKDCHGALAQRGDGIETRRTFRKA